jgi:hypothetical protein
MRRILAVLISATAVVGLASPAWAADDETTPRQRLRQAAENAESHDWPIDLTCNATTLDDKPALHCSWTAYEGADAYRVVVAGVRKNTLVARRHRIEATEFTRKVRPGRFNVLVRAVDEDHHAIARSNRVRVVVPRPAS